MDRPRDPADLSRAYRQAELRLQGLLFGDGIYSIGAVKGEERRQDVQRALRRMRELFEAAVEAGEAGRARKAEARLADLEEELRRLASSIARTRTEHTD